MTPQPDLRQHFVGLLRAHLLRLGARADLIVEKHGDEWWVLSEDRSKVLGKHDNAQDAYRQLAAIEHAKQDRADQAVQLRDAETTLAPWRSERPIEQRLDMAAKRRNFDDAARQLATVLGQGAEAAWTDLAEQVDRIHKGGLHPNDVARVAVSEPVAARIRGDVARVLRQAHRVGQADAARDVVAQVGHGKRRLSSMHMARLKARAMVDWWQADDPVAARNAQLAYNPDQKRCESSPESTPGSFCPEGGGSGGGAKVNTTAYHGTPGGERALLAAQDGQGLIGAEAERYFEARAFYVTGVLLDDMVARAKAVLFNALRAPKPIATVLSDLSEQLAPFIPETDAAGRTVNVPARLETIARTNTAEAVNEGRWATFNDADLEGVIEGYEYSAILDDRVRPNHRAWDGVTKPAEFWLGPPDRRPPDGYNCRCVLLPRILDAEITPDDALPSEEVVDPGFK